MADQVVINLSTGLEDAERVVVALRLVRVDVGTELAVDARDRRAVQEHAQGNHCQDRGTGPGRRE